MSVKELLPVGSVVLLNGGEKKLLIIGIKQINSGGDGEEYDYLGILYPEGYIGEDYQYMFNHMDIKEVVFKGYEDEERDEFIKNLSLIYGD